MKKRPWLWPQLNSVAIEFVCYGRYSSARNACLFIKHAPKWLLLIFYEFMVHCRRFYCWVIIFLTPQWSTQVWKLCAGMYNKPFARRLFCGCSKQGRKEMGRQKYVPVPGLEEGPNGRFCQCITNVYSSVGTIQSSLNINLNMI